MLSIRFDSNHEWWVSGRVFERLHKAGVKAEMLSPRLQEWFYVAEANGGLDFTQIDIAEAAELVSVIRNIAAREVQQIPKADKATDDGSYLISLQKLLALNWIEPVG